METRKILAIMVLALSLVVCQARLSEAAEMGTAFTYQGRLIDNNDVADGLYDFRFEIYDSAMDGNQLTTPLDVNEVDVIDGYFTTEIDFGAGPDSPNAVWLQIGVRPGDQNDPNAYATLSPRQKITPTPYAFYAMQSRGIFVDDEGNVGIGTASPSERFEVAGNSKITGNLTVLGGLDMSGNAITNLATLNGLPSMQLTYLTNVTGDIQTQIDWAAALDLDGAYDNGRTITVDAGAVQIDDSQTTGVSNALYVNSTGAVGGSANRTVVSIKNNAAHSSTGEITALDVDMGGDYSAGNGEATGINVDLYDVTNATTKTGVYVRMRTQSEMGIQTNGGLRVDGSTTLGSSAGDTVTINAGPLNLPNATAASDALVFGSTGSANLYRSAADTLKTDDRLVVGGTLDVTGTINADGAITGDGGDEISGMLYDVCADVDGKTVAVAEAQSVQTNAGASASAIWNLPECSTAVGARFTFVVAAGRNLNINPDAADQILGLTNAAGDSIESSTIGDTITLMIIDSSKIVVLGSYGTWTDAN